MKLDQRLAALAPSPIAAWALDLEPMKLRWANDKALEFWRAADRAELFTRDFGVSVTARTRLQTTFAATAEGRGVAEEWMFYPRGKPVAVRLCSSRLELDDGRIGLLQQAFIKDEIDPALVRSVQALHYTSVSVALLSMEGTTLVENPMAHRLFGQDAPFAARFVDAEVAPAILGAAREDRIYQAEVLVRTTEGERWHAIEARAVLDPVTGGEAILVHQTDETARRGAELDAEEKGRLVAQLHRTLDIVEAQHQEILELSAPILDVGRRTLAVPIIGAVDQARCDSITERLLSATYAQRAERVIIDLTSGAVFKAEGAEYLMKLIRAIRLLGARPIITGVRPALAGALVNAGVDLSGVLMLRSLGEGVSTGKGA